MVEKFPLKFLSLFLCFSSCSQFRLWVKSSLDYYQLAVWPSINVLTLLILTFLFVELPKNGHFLTPGNRDCVRLYDKEKLRLQMDLGHQPIDPDMGRLSKMIHMGPQ